MSEAAKAKLYAHWQALLDARNAKPPPPAPAPTHVCNRCGGSFAVKAGRTPPKQCPICFCRHWNDPTAKRRKRRVWRTT